MAVAQSGSYYMLEHRNADDVMLLRDLQPVGGTSWESGQRFSTPVPSPLYVEIVEGYEVDTIPPVYTPRVPMMRDDLLACIRSCGVDNIDAYPLTIRNRSSGENIVGYSAINIVGLVRAAAVDGTAYSPDNPSRLIDADIDRLAIDETRIRGLLFFRLAEAVTGIVVHERIKQAVEGRGAFSDVHFIHPQEWMG